MLQSHDESGRLIARKVFGSAGLTKAVQYLFLGAPNPYAWNEAAIRSAVLRRLIIAELAEFWFGGRLRVPHTYGYCWNPRARAFELRCELIRGTPAALHHPYRDAGGDGLRAMLRTLIKPLRCRLAEAGFDGLVWQAGRGNPVALNNFLCERDGDHGGDRWVWIDLESGVPALFPINPLDLLRFYLPRSLHHRRPLFDDVDIDKLRDYVARHRDELNQRLGGERTGQLETNVHVLARAQREWKSLPRHRRSIGHRLARREISPEQAAWYQHRPVHWYGREAIRTGRSIPSKLVSLVTRFAAIVASLPVGRVLKGCWDCLRSQAQRRRLARDYVARRIQCWSQRGQLSGRHEAMLHEQLAREESSAYLADFGVHLAVKPLVKVVQFWVMPALWMAGTIDTAFLGLFLIAAGPAVRTVYSLVRLVQNALIGRELPWVALGVGALPVVGNLAYPLQVIATGSHQNAAAARFILYDTFSRIGQWIPIWGGRDTLTEHVLNRLPNLVLRRRPAAADRGAAVSVGSSDHDEWDVAAESLPARS
ncbi:MAG: hypothetical protein ACE5EX_04980 [Phycisphaerae bacterium]